MQLCSWQLGNDLEDFDKLLLDYFQTLFCLPSLLLGIMFDTQIEEDQRAAEIIYLIEKYIADICWGVG